jgi:hypothetical protein
MQRSLLALAVLCALALPSCIVAAAAGGAAAGLWYTGSAETHVDADPRAVVDAALAALEELDLEVSEHASSALSGRVVAHDADDDRIVVSVDANEGAQSSQVVVRVGFRDEAAAQRILDEIVTKL